MRSSASEDRGYTCHILQSLSSRSELDESELETIYEKSYFLRAQGAKPKLCAKLLRAEVCGAEHTAGKTISWLRSWLCGCAVHIRLLFFGLVSRRTEQLQQQLK